MAMRIHCIRRNSQLYSIRIFLSHINANQTLSSSSRPFWPYLDFSYFAKSNEKRSTCSKFCANAFYNLLYIQPCSHTNSLALFHLFDFVLLHTHTYTHVYVCADAEFSYNLTVQQIVALLFCCAYQPTATHRNYAAINDVLLHCRCFCLFQYLCECVCVCECEASRLAGRRLGMSAVLCIMRKHFVYACIVIVNFKFGLWISVVLLCSVFQFFACPVSFICLLLVFFRCCSSLDLFNFCCSRHHSHGSVRSTIFG